MPGKTASTSLATRSDLITITRTEMLSGRKPVQEERATAQDDGRQPTGARQQRSVVGSAHHTEQVAARLVELLLLTERTDRSSVASTDMSMSACATSSPDGTRWQGAGQDGSPVKSSTGNAD